MGIGNFIKEKAKKLKENIQESIEFNKKLKEEEEKAFRKARLENLEELEREKEKERRKAHLKKYKMELKKQIEPKKEERNDFVSNFQPSSEFAPTMNFDFPLKGGNI